MVHIQRTDLDSLLENWLGCNNNLAKENRYLLRLRPVLFLVPTESVEERSKRFLFVGPNMG